MIFAIVMGFVLGPVGLAVVFASTSRWARAHLPEWFTDNAFGVVAGLGGVVGSAIVSSLADDNGYGLFVVQLVAFLATLLLVGWPLRHRLRRRVLA